VKIRRPRYEDAARIAEVHVRTWKQTYEHLLPAGFFTEDHARGRNELWSRILAEPQGKWNVHVAEVAGELVGFAMADAAHPTGPSEPIQDRNGEPAVRELYTLYVLDSHHGAGAGQALLDATVGHDPVGLWVAKQNPRAIAFYQRNGFVFTGDEKSDPSAPAITDARMIRSQRSAEARRLSAN